MKLERKPRLDVFLVSEGYFSSRERAQAAIVEGAVFVEGERITKPGYRVDPGTRVILKKDPIPYVGRGGIKLRWALDVFAIETSGRIALDVGASTGGFTDCLLSRGVRKVFAVDVGYGQLAWTLRTDPRVVVMERTNARYLTPRSLSEHVHLATIDVSFISLKHILGPVGTLTLPGGDILALVKPQFEAGRTQVPKGGVIRDMTIQRGVLEKVASYGGECGFLPVSATFSPVKGTKGNTEFWIHFRKGATGITSLPDTGGITGTEIIDDISGVPGPNSVGVSGDWAGSLVILAEAFFREQKR